MSSTLREYFDTITGATFAYPSGNGWLAQSFVASAAYLIDEVQIRCQKTAAGTSGNVTVSIRAVDANRRPTGADLVSKTVSYTALSTSMSWHSFIFDTPYLLTKNVEYAIVFREAIAGAYILTSVSIGAGSYAGNASISSNAGGSWSDYDGDFNFKAFGETQPVPDVTTVAATEIGYYDSDLNGSIVDKNEAVVDYIGFVWDTISRAKPAEDDAPADTDYSNNYLSDEGDYDVGNHSHSIASLDDGITYYFRFCAHSVAGWGWGDELEFTTYADPEDKWVQIPTVEDVLTKDNTTEFTPDADYEPATKKYVDDEIGGIVEADPVFGASEAANFAAGDKDKLDGIEASADVTDATNVAAAGAVMEADESTASMSFVVDEDDMVSNLDTKVPTQQSVKAYTDNTSMMWAIVFGG